MYVISAAQNSKQDKVNEFFEKMTPQLQGQPVWSEWFGETHFMSQGLIKRHSTKSFVHISSLRNIVCSVPDFTSFLNLA